MKKISHAELIELVRNSPGAFPIGLLTETDARAKKTGNPFGEIKKRVYAVGFVGANYEASVNREAGRQGGEGEFKAKPRQWGEWLPGLESKVATHKGKLYLRTQSTPGQRERQKAEVLFYRGENGQFLRHRDVAPFLPAKSFSARQATVGVGTDTGEKPEQIDVREYAFDSILRIRHKGETFEVVPG